VAEIAGLTLITPSSVAGSGVSLSGAKVTFTSATSISMNGIFSSSYDNYLIVMWHVHSANTSMALRLRNSGTDESGSYYAHQYVYADGTTEAGSRSTSQTSVRVGSTSTPITGNHIYIYGPALAQPTATRNVGSSSEGGAFILDYAGTQNQSTAYDGCSILSLSGTFNSGSLTIYGLSQ
jgi:hypothetical protein